MKPSMLISRGLLNLTHRESRELPESLQPGRRLSVSIQLNVTGYAVPSGHRLRVAISPTYWPMAWPSPEPVTLTVFAGRESFLELPLRTPRADDAELSPFGPPETAPPLEIDVVRPSSSARSTIVTGVVEQTVSADDGSWRQVVTGLEYESTGVARYHIHEARPLSARQQYERTFRIGRGEWQTRVAARSELTADRDTFHVSSALDVFDGDERIFSRTWSVDVPSDHV